MEINKQRSTVRSSASEAIIDQGLRAHMLMVYNYMAAGVLLTGFVALLSFKLAAITSAEGQIIGLTSYGNTILNSGLKWVIAFSPLAIVLYMSFGAAKISTARAQTLFWIFCVLMGASLTVLFVYFTGLSITRVFFITAGTFGAMSIYGYTTKRDLTKLGSFCMMGLFGIIIASFVNIFTKSPMAYYVISYIGVLVFIGLTAYDTQKIKNMYLMSEGSSSALLNKQAIYGALTLYLDFINLFIFLLRIFGQRR